MYYFNLNFLFYYIVILITSSVAVQGQDVESKKKISPVVGSWTIEASKIQSDTKSPIRDHPFIKKGAIWKFRRDETANLNEDTDAKWSYDSDVNELVLEVKYYDIELSKEIYGRFCKADVKWIDKNNKMKLTFKRKDVITDAIIKYELILEKDS